MPAPSLTNPMHSTQRAWREGRCRAGERASRFVPAGSGLRPSHGHSQARRLTVTCPLCSVVKDRSEGRRAKRGTDEPEGPRFRWLRCLLPSRPRLWRRGGATCWVSEQKTPDLRVAWWGRAPVAWRSPLGFPQSRRLARSAVVNAPVVYPTPRPVSTTVFAVGGCQRGSGSAGR